MLYWRSVFLVLLAACSYGVLSTFMKFAFHAGYTPYEMSGGQLIFGGAIMSAVAFFLSRERFTFKHFLILLPASLMMACTSIFYHQAVHYVSASLAIVLLFQFTWIGVLMEAVAERKWPTLEKWLSLALLGAGTVLASGMATTGIGEVDMQGVVYGLLSGLTYATVIFFSGRLGTRINPYLRSAVSISSAALILSLVYPPTFLVNGRLLDGLLPYALIVACLGSVIPILCLTIGVPRIGNGLATILCAAELPIAVLMSSMVLKEHVSPEQWTGVLLILVAIALPQLNIQQRLPLGQRHLPKNM
jgi:drug/metabolite transporter (DMT)-like permease